MIINNEFWLEHYSNSGVLDSIKNMDKDYWIFPSSEEWVAISSNFPSEKADLVINQRIKVAWQAANDWQESQFDTNSRIAMLALMADPSCTASRMAKIQANIAWGNVVWMHYAEVKAKIKLGIDEKYDTSMPGPVPFSIWEISE